MNEYKHGVSPQDTFNDSEKQASKELAELSLEVKRENVEAIISQMKTDQHPNGFEEILSNLNTPERLKEAMSESNINSIVHSEGQTVWDHVRASIVEIGTLDMPDNLKSDLRLIMLYHDLGKIEVADSAENAKATEKKLAKGELHRSMIGHADAKKDEILSGLQANGISGDKLDRFMAVIANHMKTSLIEQDPKKTVKLFETLGQNDAERRETVQLLIAVQQADSNATEHINLVDGKLNYSRDEEKPKLDFEVVWNKYEEGKKQIQREQENQAKKKTGDEQEQAIFGAKLSDYLIKQRGVQPGPAIGKAMGQIKSILAKNSGMAPEDLRKIIDAMEF